MSVLPLFAIYGAGGSGRGIMPFARKQHLASALPLERLVFIDAHLAGTRINGHKVVDEASFLAEPASCHFVAIAIASSKVRAALDARLALRGACPWTVISANSEIFDEVVIGEGALISPFVTLASNVVIGRHFHANLYSYIEHDCIIGDFVTLAPGAKVNGNVVIEDHAYIGSGAVVKQGRPGHPLMIGAGAIIGMGAVVTKSVAAGVTVVGNPARPMPSTG